MHQQLKQSTVGKVPLKVYLSSDGKSPATGKTLAVVISKNGALTFSAAGGSIAEATDGWYVYTPSSSDTSTLGPLVVRTTGTDCDPAEEICEVVVDLPGVAQTGDNYPSVRDNVVRRNTATGGSLSTIKLDAGASATDDAYKDLEVVKIPASGFTEVRGITAYVGATQLATVDEDFLVAAANTDTFVIRSKNVSGLILDTITAANFISCFFANGVLSPSSTIDKLNVAVGSRATDASAVAALFAALVETGFTFQQVMQLIGTAVGGKRSGANTGVEVFRNLSDTKARITVASDALGNTMSITFDFT